MLYSFFKNKVLHVLIKCWEFHESYSVFPTMATQLEWKIDSTNAETQPYDLDNFKIYF